MNKNRLMAYLSEYMEYRRSTWQSYANRAFAQIHNEGKDRRSLCKDMIAQIEKLNTPEQYMDFIEFRIAPILNESIKSAQQTVSTQQSFFSSFAGVVSQNFNQLGEIIFVLHAIRTEIIYHIKTEHKTIYDEKVKQLQDVYDRLNSHIKSQEQRNLTVPPELQTQADLALLRLCYYQVSDSIREAHYQRLLPKLQLTQIEINKLNYEEFNPNIHHAFNDRYFEVYISLKINEDTNRRTNFNALLTNPRVFNKETENPKTTRGLVLHQTNGNGSPTSKNKLFSSTNSLPSDGEEDFQENSDPQTTLEENTMTNHFTSSH